MYWRLEKVIKELSQEKIETAQLADKVGLKNNIGKMNNGSIKSLPCVKGGAEERGGGIVIYAYLIKNNPSVALRQLPLHKGAFLFCANRQLAFS